MSDDPREVAPLHRALVEEVLRSLGVLGGDEQVRPVTRSDVDVLAQMNGVARAYGRPTCDGLDFSLLEFVEHIDLSHMSFEHASFRRAHLAYSNFDDSSLLHADLSGAMMSRASCRRASLHDANLDSVWANNLEAEGARLNRAKLTGMDLRFVNLEGADASEAVFARTDMWRANCAGAKFYRADMRAADFWNTDFNGASFAGAALDGAILRGCNLRGATFGNVQRQNGTYVIARLEGAEFAEVVWGENFVVPEESDGLYQAAGAVYRSLKDVHQRAGMYDLADEFAFREQVAGRKLAWAEKQRISFVARVTAEVVFGFGYR